MKHAYLIIAHNEFKILSYLVKALDDERNDIYVHIDKKVKKLPNLETQHSKLFFTKKRIDVRWGNVSQIESEYVLFEEAYMNNKYAYYHIISGTHIPLVSQDYMHEFFKSVDGKQVLQLMYINDFQINLKMQRYNLFTKYFNKGSLKKRLFFQRLWNFFIIIQRKLNITRNNNVNFILCSNWVSITNDAVEYLIKNKQGIIKRYRYTLCGDEFFVPTELSASPLKGRIYYYDKILKFTFLYPNPKIYTIDDYNEIKNSGCLFARKFSEQNIDVVEKILEHIGITK